MMRKSTQDAFLAERMAGGGMILPVYVVLEHLVRHGVVDQSVYEGIRERLALEIGRIEWMRARDAGCMGIRNRAPDRVSGWARQRAVEYIQRFETENRLPVEHYALVWDSQKSSVFDSPPFAAWFANTVTWPETWDPSDVMGVPIRFPKLEP